MKTHFLFPSSFRKIGLSLVIGSLSLLVVFTAFGISLSEMLDTSVFAIAEGGFLSDNRYFTIIQNDISDELFLICIIVGALFIGFARHKNEDEYIAQIRYESLVWATYFNFSIMLLSMVFIYGTYYFTVLSLNIFSLLLFFIIRFQIKLYQLQKAQDDE